MPGMTRTADLPLAYNACKQAIRGQAGDSWSLPLVMHSQNLIHIRKPMRELRAVWAPGSSSDFPVCIAPCA